MSYKPITADDVTTTKTYLYEAIPITGSIVYGTYAGDGNIKNYTHGMFQSVYDYPYLSSSANHIFDITMGYDETSALSASSNTVQQKKKINVYNQMGLTLLGVTGSKNVIRRPENDLTLDQTGSMRNLFFLNFSRLLTKDQIRPGSFSMKVLTASHGALMAESGFTTISDVSSSITQGTLNTQGGNYGVLYTDKPNLSHPSTDQDGNHRVGIIFYEAGIVMLTGSIFGAVSGAAANFNAAGQSWQEAFTGSAVSGNCDTLRARINDVSFNNTTEINSTIYFCRANHNDFNYSSNMTYLSASQIRIKNVASDLPVSYVTTVGLYSANNELLAVAKLSEPLRKDPTTELTLRVRLDY